MMGGIARMTDIWCGICCCHPECIDTTGIIVGCSQDVKANNLGVARLGDIVISDCGHVAEIVTSSSSVKANNIGVARISDIVSSDCIFGEIVAVSPNVKAD